VNGYEVVRILSGLRQKKIMAAHWVIEEGQFSRRLREKGKTTGWSWSVTMTSELEGRAVMDSDEFKLPLSSNCTMTA